MDYKDFVILAFCNMNYFVEFLTSTGLDQYTNYIEGTITFMPNQPLIRFQIAILYGMNWKTIIREGIISDFSMYAVHGVLCAWFTSVNMYGGWVTLFFYNLMCWPTFFEHALGRRKHEDIFKRFLFR